MNSFNSLREQIESDFRAIMIGMGGLRDGLNSLRDTIRIVLDRTEDHEARIQNLERRSPAA